MEDVRQSTASVRETNSEEKLSITYTDTHIWTQVIGKLVRTLVQDRNLLQTQLSVSVSNLFAEFMRQGVQHGMVRMHARQPILLQLFSHDSHQGFHP